MTAEEKKKDTSRLAPGRRVPEEWLAQLQKDAVATVARMESRGVGTLTCWARRIRACRWSHQYPDERKWGDSAWPYEGASDAREYVAEEAVRDLAAMDVVAAATAQLSFGGVAGNSDVALTMAQTWHDLIHGVLARDWFMQLSLLSVHLHGDGTGCSALWIDWDHARELRPAPLALETARALFQQAGRDLDMALADPEKATQGLRELGLDVPDEAGEELAGEAQATTMRLPVTVRDQPAVRALSLGEDLYMDPATRLGSDDGPYHVVEWISPVQLRARAEEEGWDDSFVRKLEALGGKQSAVFPLWGFASSNEADWSVDRVEKEREAGRLQVVRSYVLATTPAGVPGRFEVVWAPGVDVAARPARLLSRFPILVFSLEPTGAGAMDGRGEAGRLAGLQGQSKRAADMVSNIADFQLPPMVTKGRKEQGDGELYVEPLGEIQLSLVQDAKWLTPPPFPQTVFAWQKDIRLRLDRLLGLENEDIPAPITQRRQQARMRLWLDQVAEAIRRVLTLCVEHFPEEAFADYPELASRESLPVRLRFDARMSDPEWAKGKIAVFKELMGIDEHATIDKSAAVAGFLADFLPEHAEFSPRTPDRAQQDERADEQRVYTLMRAGVRTEVPEQGADYRERLAFYEELEQANPAAYADLGPDKQQLIAERKQALQFQVQQRENAITGRRGVENAAPAVEATEAPGGEV